VKCGDHTLRVVVDTNVWVSGLILPASTPGEVLTAARNRQIDLVVSWALVDELLRVLRSAKIRKRYSITDTDIVDIALLLSPVLPTVEVEVPTRDPNDAPVVEAALAGRADVIVTGDHDFLRDEVLCRWLLEHGVEALGPAELLERLRS
jgi:putative PIN family toxin of toxin-antitoxin system